ncbi:MAG: hypothetical protein ABFD69_12620 [Candidatus Sumerlaeia bacterium]
MNDSARRQRIQWAVLAAAAIGLAVVISQARMVNWGAWARADLAQPWRGPWRFPVESAMAAGSAFAVYFAIFGIGLLIIAAGRRRWAFSPFESLALAPLVGGVPVSLAVLGAGLAGFAWPVELIFLLAVCVVLGALGWRLWLLERRAIPAGRPRKHNPFLVLMLVVVFVLAVPYALAPVIQSDALRYHVAAPAQWLRAGRIHYLPYQAFSNFPFLGEVLFMLAMAVGGDSAAQAVHFGMLPISMGLIGILARRWTRGGGGASDALAGHANDYTAFAAIAFALIPSVPILAGWGFIDLFTTAYFLGFALIGAAALANPGRGREWLLGFMIAGGLSTKYTMLPLLAGLGVAWWLALARRQPFCRSLRAAAIAGLVGLALASPWYARNCAWTGNPVYPLAIKQFDGGDWTPANDAFYRAKAAEKGFRLAGWPRPVARPLELLITPYTTAYYPNRFEDHLLGPIPLVALLIALGSLFSARRSVLRLRSSGLSWLFVVLAGSWAFWFFTYQSSRMLLPTIGLLLAWAAAGWWRTRGAARWAVGLLSGLAMLLSAGIFSMFMLVPFNPGSNAHAIATAMGFESREAFLARSVGYWPSARWLSRQAAPGEKALLVGEHRSLYFDLPILVSDWFDTPQPLPLIKQTKDNDDMFDRLLNDNVRYVFYNAEELRKYYDLYFVPRFSPEEIHRFEELFPVRGGTSHHPRLEEIDRRGGMITYRIQPRPKS